MFDEVIMRKNPSLFPAYKLTLLADLENGKGFLFATRGSLIRMELTWRQ